MDKIEHASEKVSSAKRKLEAQWGNLKSKMTSISLLGDAHHFDETRSKVDVLRKQLDDSKHSKKLEAMKTVTAMMSLGRDMSALFPDVVKCVAVDNMEIKKLVYRYVTHYAKENPELALLAISTFQKDMKSPNPLVRGKALQAMSGLEVPTVLRLTQMAVKDANKDSSAYVRKISCHCLARLLKQDPKSREDVEEMLEVLMGDIEVMVLESVMFAFNQICPERWDLIHRHFRKLCHLLADMEPWGQICTLQMLMKYSRNQFEDPNKHRRTLDSDEERELDLQHDVLEDEVDQEIDTDHRLLLKSARNLMFSMNASVVMHVTAIHYYLAPDDEYIPVARILMGHLGRRREIDFCILSNIAVMCANKANVFAPFYKRFYINGSEPVCNKELKLDILSRLANQGNISHLLREFQTYVKDDNIKFRCATIEAMGRCADQVPDVSESILRGLMGMASSHSQTVIASAIVVVRQIIQKSPENYTNIIKSLILLLDDLEVPEARAAIVWIIGEYRELVPDYTIDVLRKLCKNFRKEDSQVKLQALNLAIKLFLFQGNFTSEHQKILKKLFKYLLDLCRFDRNYDIRDRCRLCRSVFLRGKKKGETTTEVKQEVRQMMQQMFFTEKPKPKINSPYKAREELVLGTLSLQVMHQVKGYMALEDCPETAPDHGEREAGEPETQANDEPDEGFYNSESESDDSMDTYGYSDSEAGLRSSGSDDDDQSFESGSFESEEADASSDDDMSASQSEDSEEESSEEEFSIEEPMLKPTKKIKPGKKRRPEKSDSDDESEDSDEEWAVQTKKSQKKKKDRAKSKKKEEPVVDDDPFGFGDFASKPAAPGAAMAGDDFLSSLLSPKVAGGETEEEVDAAPVGVAKPAAPSTGSTLDDIFSGLGHMQSNDTSNNNLLDALATKPVQQFTMKSTKKLKPSATAEVCLGASGQLLNHAGSKGLQIDFAFSRKPSEHGADFLRIRLDFTNKWNESIRSVKIDGSKDAKAPSVILRLEPEETKSSFIHIRFGGSQVAILNLSTSSWKGSARLSAPPGELMVPLEMSAADFAKKQKAMSGGMSMNEVKIGSNLSLQEACNILEKNFNAKLIEDSGFKVGDKITRKGLRGEIIKIDQQLIPPSCDVRMSNGSVVNTEFGLLTKAQSDALHKKFAATSLRDKSTILFQIRGKNSLSVKVHCQDFMFMTPLIDQTNKAFKK